MGVGELGLRKRNALNTIGSDAVRFLDFDGWTLPKRGFTFGKWNASVLNSGNNTRMYG